MGSVLSLSQHIHCTSKLSVSACRSKPLKIHPPTCQNSWTHTHPQKHPFQWSVFITHQTIEDTMAPLRSEGWNALETNAHISARRFMLQLPKTHSHLNHALQKGHLRSTLANHMLQWQFTLPIMLSDKPFTKHILQRRVLHRRVQLIQPPYPMKYTPPNWRSPKNCKTPSTPTYRTVPQTRHIERHTPHVSSHSYQNSWRHTHPQTHPFQWGLSFGPGGIDSHCHPFAPWYITG